MHRFRLLIQVRMLPRRIQPVRRFLTHQPNLSKVLPSKSLDARNYYVFSRKIHVIGPACFEDLELQHARLKAQTEKFGDKVVHVIFEKETVSCEDERCWCCPSP